MNVMSNALNCEKKRKKNMLMNWNSLSKNSDCDANTISIIQILSANLSTLTQPKFPIRKLPPFANWWIFIFFVWTEMIDDVSPSDSKNLKCHKEKWERKRKRGKMITQRKCAHSPEGLSCDMMPFIGLKLTISEMREFRIRLGCGVDGNSPWVDWSELCMDLWLLLFNSIEVSSSPKIFDKWLLTFVFDWVCEGCDIDAECSSVGCICCGWCCIAKHVANSLYSLNLTSFLRALLEFWLFCVIDRMAELFISLAIAEFVGSITLVSVGIYASVPLNTLLIRLSNSNKDFADCVLFWDETTVLVRCESHSLLKPSSLPSRILLRLRCAVRNGYVDGLPIITKKTQIIKFGILFDFYLFNFRGYIG